MTKVERTRQKILQNTYIYIVKNNDIPTMRQIAREAGMGLGSIYYHFNTISDIFIELDRLSHTHISQFLMEKTEGEKNPLYHFMSVEILRLLFLASREAYSSLSIIRLFMRSQFTESRVEFLRNCLSKIIEECNPLTITSYSGQYIAFMYEWLIGTLDMSVYEMMTFHFKKVFLGSLGDDVIMEVIEKTHQLGEIVIRSDLALEWLNTEETQLRDDIDKLPLNRFDRKS